MKKNLTLLTLIALFLFSSNIVFAQKSQTNVTSAKPVKSGIKSTPAKPAVKKSVVTTTPAKPTVTKTSVSPTPVSTQNKITNEKYKEGTKPQKPVIIKDQITPLTATSSEIPNAKSIEKDLYENFWVNYSIYNGEESVEESRKCNCRGDIIFVNQTNDTLDMYFGYVPTAQQSLTANAMMPAWSYQAQRAAFCLLPGEKNTIRGWCEGTLQYQAIGRKNKMDDSKNLTPYFEQKHYVKMSCRDIQVNLEE
jgi:hypothetical protein